ncbi:ABC transporter permease [bacterium]|nr:ABC transporter permease [bacterium]
MLQNYLKIAIRNLLKHKTYSAINILGLAVGMASCLIILLFVQYELSYDRYHAHADRIYRVSRQFYNQNGQMNLWLGPIAPPFAPLLRTDFPQIKVAQFLRDFNTKLKMGEQAFIENRFFWADEHVLDVFSFELVKGDRRNVLKEPNSIVLTESAARKYFGNADPMGKIINYEDQLDLKVTGILKDIPENSHFHIDILASFVTLQTIFSPGTLMTNFGSNNYPTYVFLPEGMDAGEFEQQLVKFVDKHVPVPNPSIPKASAFTLLKLQPITDIHLHSHLDSEIEPNGDILYVYIFSAVAFFILLIACINFMNLSTAKAADRSREVGVRKVVGAGRQDLIRQFLSETIILAFIALILAIGLVELALPYFNAFIGKNLSLNPADNYFMLASIITIALLTGLISGSYPAFFLSAFEPVVVLKGKLSNGSGSSWLRSTLVVTQFSITIALLCGIGIIQNQLDFCRTADLGFKHDHVLAILIPQSARNKIEDVKNQLKQNSNIVAVSASSRFPSGRLLDSFNMQVDIGGEMKAVNFRIASVFVDHDYMTTYDMPIAAGRDFLKEFVTDDTAAVIFNESAVKALGWTSNEDALNKRVNFGNRRSRVVGVVKDFHFESMREKIAPMIFAINPNFTGYFSIRIRPENVPATLEFLKERWAEYDPDVPFNYQFIDENFDQLYRNEEQLSRVLGYFAGLGTFIACLGLIGLAAFMAERRTKEIGIRKVMGATVANIVGLMSKEFVRLVIVANLVAWPLAYFAMDRWLDHFAYRISIGPAVFIIAGVVTLAIALGTVSFQAFRAATGNPVNALKYE